MSLLRVRWLGRVAYREAEALQRALHAGGAGDPGAVGDADDADDYLLLLEHPPVYTLGSSARREHVLVSPASVGAELMKADRGGDVTYHGPGQLVGYPIVSLAAWRAGQRDVVAYVRRLEDVLVAALADFGVAAGRRAGYPGVWVGDEKIAAIGVRVARGRTRHGFALNVDPDLGMFDNIVPCGIRDKGVTSLARVLGGAPPMREVADRVVARFGEIFGRAEIERQDVAWRDAPAGLTLPEAGVRTETAGPARRPEWMRVRADFGAAYRDVRRLTRGLALHTVCEEAGCPNICECWSERTATFMILGDRCTRACGFCLVDTRHPLPVDEGEPARVAEAVQTLGLEHAVVTCVARDDLPDGGARIFAETIAAIRTSNPDARVEVLISDCKGDPDALGIVFDARPDVLGHNLETVARLQRAARPSAGYARSLAVLARGREAGLPTKSGLVLGMGETAAEVRGAIADLRAVGVEILTLGQYLRPSPRHLPVARWWHPEEFAALREFAEGLGFAHVEAGPLVRSSYHAKQGAAAAVSGSAAFATRSF